MLAVIQVGVLRFVQLIGSVSNKGDLELKVVDLKAAGYHGRNFIMLNNENNSLVVLPIKSESLNCCLRGFYAALNLLQ